MPTVSDPVAAATHPNPYPYYASLVADGGFHRDERPGLWVASSAAHVTAVLMSDRSRVRPPADKEEPRARRAKSENRLYVIYALAFETVVSKGGPVSQR